MGATVEEEEDNGGPTLGDIGAGGKLAGTSRDKTLEQIGVGAGASTEKDIVAAGAGIGDEGGCISQCKLEKRTAI